MPVLCIGSAENKDLQTERIENPLLLTQEGLDNVVINKAFREKQTNVIKTLLEIFEDVLTEVAGKTSILEHDVKLTSDIPVCRKAYIISYAKREKSRRKSKI